MIQIIKRFLLIFISMALIAVVVFLAAGLWPEKIAITPAGYPEHQSMYVTVKDGTKVAIRLTLPSDLEENEQVPTIMETTRYGTEFDKTFLINALLNLGIGKERLPKVFDMFSAAGYAVVRVDARGSGASFGSREMEWSIEEIADMGEIMDWIAMQPWSNGKVGTYGVSYSGNTAELAMATGSKSLAASAPLYPDFNPIKQSAMPGGVFNETLIHSWSDANISLDANGTSIFSKGITPVDDDPQRTLLNQALSQRHNINIFEAINDKTYFDDFLAEGYTLSSLCPFTYKDAIEASNVPLYVRVGWHDAGTVNGALERFLTYSNPQTLVIGPWSHAGYYFFDPFLPNATDEETIYSQMDELEISEAEALIDFFDTCLKEDNTPLSKSQIQYYTLGEGVWKTTDTWPVEGFEETKFYFGANGSLSTETAISDTDADIYKVDYTASTGSANRWFTNIGGGMIDYPDRANEDTKLLTYTSQPMESTIEITGVPVVTLNLSSNQTDGAVFVYLEDVAPDGTVTYITEGQLRLLHRAESKRDLGYTAIGPAHTYESQDGALMIPNENTQVSLELYATSVQIKKGHAVRIAIAGHDAANFRMITNDPGDTVLTVQCNSQRSSYVSLPVKSLEE